MSANLIGRPDPRQRIQAIGDHYHIVLRANRRQALFSTPADRRALNRFAIEALLRFEAALHAYCLMPHHFRFLVQMKEKQLVKAVRRIVHRYSRHLHRHAKFSETPFDRPFEARRIATGDDFLECLRSIHLGPVLANLVTTADDYRWSSHRAYLGYKSVSWVRTEFGLSLLSPDLARARTAYPEFISGAQALEVEHQESVDPTRGIIDRLMGIRSEGEPIDARPQNQPPASPHRTASWLIGDGNDESRRILSIY